MKPLLDFKPAELKVIFTDIDGTLTSNGRLSAASYEALWRLQDAGLMVIPVTGRPAGWCDLIARFWPVHGVIGENGGLCYRLTDERMLRHEMLSPRVRRSHRDSLQQIARAVKEKIPRARIAADQFSRRFDLAIDFAEDVHPRLTAKEVDTIVDIFTERGAHAKVSNIHVNGWFGDYDKRSGCEWYCRNWLGFELKEKLNACVFVGDSPNDEPMFKLFPQSVGVANVKDFAKRMKSPPAYVTTKPEGSGFVEFADHVLKTIKN